MAESRYSMSNYLLYGTELIKDDSTLQLFAKSLCNNLDIHYTGDSNYEDFKETSMDYVEEHLKDDISRTSINYEELMYKFRNELGDLLYEVENHGYELQDIFFYGDKAQTSFNDVVYNYIYIHFDELCL
jgi:hypothetical protein